MAAMAEHMAKIQELSDAFLSSGDVENNDKVVEIHKIIKSSSSLSILTLVEALAGVLTNESVQSRLQGTKLLAQYIHICSQDEFASQEVETLIAFFCDRLKDHHSIQPMVMYAFLGLVSHQTVDDELIVKMLQSIFAEVHVQSLVQADRHNVFNLFGNLLNLKLNVLRRISGDFVLGFIQAMDSERDPRNLLICFQNSYIVLTELDFSLFVEDFFEVLSCYFPIDFTPPKENHFQITKDDLIVGLRQCLTSTSLFAPYAIPLYIDKLSSDIVEAKKDSLVTFKESFPLFTGKDIELFINDIWMCIRKDFLLGENKELHFLYIDFIKALIECLLKNGCVESLATLVGYLLKDCLQTLKDPEMTIAVQCGDLIHIFCTMSSDLFEKILQVILPPITTSISKYSSPMQRKNLLEFVVKIISVDPSKISNADNVKILTNFVETHLSVFLMYLQEGGNSELTCLSLACLTQMVKYNSTYNISVDVISKHVFNMLFSISELTKSILEITKVIVSELTSRHPELVEKHFLAILENNGHLNEDILENCIMLLFQCKSQFQDRIIGYLMKMLEKTNDKHSIFIATVRSLCDILDNSEVRIDQSVVCAPILALVSAQTNLKDVFLEGFVKIVSSSYKALGDTQKVDALTNAVALTQRTVSSDMQQSHYTLVSVVCVGIIAQAEPTHLKNIDSQSVVESLWKLYSLEGSECYWKYFGLCLASTVNKLAGPDLIRLVLSLVKERIASGNSTDSAINAFCWLTKGCVLNWQPLTQDCLVLITDYLKQPSLGQSVAQGFELLVSGDTLALSKDSGAIIKLMYKQRFSQLVLPSLMESYQTAENEVKAFLITAISCTLHMMPKQMLQAHLKKLMPLLMHSLATSTSDEVLQSTVCTILSVCDQNQEIVQQYIDTLIPRLLSVISHAKMKIRIASLQCLSKFSSYPLHSIFSMKNDVIRSMRTVLDDSKRLVRKEAVACSTAWHLIG